jgi:hypothetical protein
MKFSGLWLNFWNLAVPSATFVRNGNIPAMQALTAWANFYVIVGSSAGALTGLQFVVMALISENKMEGTMAEIRAFGTPTIVHFCSVLFASAMMSAPWGAMTSLTTALGALAIAGIAYALVVLRRTWAQSRYQPVLEDWLWHCAFPLICYVCIGIAAIVLSVNGALALFILAGVEVSLLFVGIHNAWDTVTYIVIESRAQGRR